MGGISEYFYDEAMFFDRYIMNSPVLSASCYNVSKDTMISTLAARKITPPEAEDDFTAYAMSSCPFLKEQGAITRNNLISAAALVGDKENRLNFLRNFSRKGVMDLYGSGKNQYYMIYDLITPEVTCFVLTQMVIMKEADSGDILASFITKDISRLKRFRKIATMAINSICECISIIDVNERTITFDSISDDLTRHLTDVGIDGKIDYDTTFTGILDETATEGETPISEKVSIENLVSELNKNGEYIIIYDLESTHGDISRKQVIFQWFDNDHKFIAALQSDVSTTYREERNQLEKLNRELNLKLGKDQVTGLPNKNSSEIQISERFNPGNSMIFLFDLTNLIYLNNTVGRDIGNMLLYQFAHLISVSMPSGSFVGRYTGAEIIVLCNGLNHGDEKTCLERISSKVENYNNENPDCMIEYVFTSVYASEFENCDFPKLYAKAFRNLVDAKNKKGIPDSAKEDLNYQLREMSNKSRELEYASKHDGLTGLLNKTSGLDEISVIVRRLPQRYHVMFVMDIDNFKHINDTFGHDFGDEVLKKTAEIIRNQFRPSDILVRYGGDEFIAFMANVTGPAQIEDKALNLINEVDRMLFECGCRKTAGSDVSEFENATGLSIGIVWADKPAIASDMFVQADSALYDAKRAGKNRFEITRNMGIANE